MTFKAQRACLPTLGREVAGEHLRRRQQRRKRNERTRPQTIMHGEKVRDRNANCNSVTRRIAMHAC